jgi:hypothetical protein
MKKHNLVATIESAARDCDGFQYRTVEYNMLLNEAESDFGDLDFFRRMVTFVVSTSAESGTLHVKQVDGLPEFTWDEQTEEGYRHDDVTFRKEF